MLRLAGFTVTLFALLAVDAGAQNCQPSADANYLLNTISDLRRHSALPSAAFHSMLPCKSAPVSTRLLVDALEGTFTLDEKKDLIQSFHLQSPLRTEDVDAISKCSLSGQFVDELVSPLKHSDLRIELNFQLDPATLSRLKQKGVSSETLSTLRVAPVSQPTIVAPAPEIGTNAYGDPLAKSLPFSRGPGPGAGTDDTVYHAGGDVSMPQLISKVEPEYSEEARTAEYCGTVLLSIIVDEHGLPRDIKVIRPVGLGLDEKAIEAVSLWRFRPGMKGGRPVAVQANIEVSFHIASCSAATGESVRPRETTTGTQTTKQARLLPPEVKPTVNAQEPFLLGVQIVEVRWNTGSYGGAMGYGRGNLIQSNGKQGFEFTFSCSKPFLSSEGSGLYSARWKKQDTRLVIRGSEIGNPNKHSDCELRVSKQPFIYGVRPTTVYTVPMNR